MRKNLVISRKLSHNLEGWYGYHISKNSKLYKISKACVSHYLNRYKPKI